MSLLLDTKAFRKQLRGVALLFALGLPIAAFMVLWDLIVFFTGGSAYSDQELKWSLFVLGCGAFFLAASLHEDAKSGA